MRFPYRRYEVSATPASLAEDSILYRPVIPFTLLGRSDALDFFGLLDTGADETYVTRSMADRLGISIDEHLTSIVESASGEMPMRYGTATLEVSDGKESYRWTAIVGIADQDWAEAILGHAGFLEFFDAHFRGHDCEVVLTRNEASLPAADPGP